MELDETFVPIPFFENYAVSNYGTVIHLDSETELRQWMSAIPNRMKVRFHVLGAYIDFFVDDLVTQAFFVNWHPGINIYYKNHDHYDCTVLNLTFDPKYAEENHGSKYRRIRVDNRGKIRVKDRR